MVCRSQRSWLGAASAQQVRYATAAAVSVDRLGKRLEETQAFLETAENRVNAYQADCEELQLEEGVLNERIDGLERDNDYLREENDYLRKRLAEAKDYEGAHGFVPKHERPKVVEAQNFDEVSQLIPELDGVVFTGDVDKMLDLDPRDTVGTLARSTWKALLALQDYVRARNAGDWDAGITGYLENTPVGYTRFEPGRFAPVETRATMDQFGHYRVFPVPQEVDPSGRKTMAAHFKIGKLGSVSPRMHVLDCWTTHKNVIVGYIGPHLPNTQTKSL